MIHLVALVASLALTPATAAEYAGRVINVYDGDTAAVETGADRLSVRLAHIDAPDLAQAYGHEARMLLSSLVYGRYIQLEDVRREASGLTTARVRLGSLDVGFELVRQGAAWCQRMPPSAECEALQARAQSSRRGLWGMPDPVPPWAFRHGRLHAR
ncbi:endonuclease YncB(thermonuclease family) [Plasticicumulans lactativorans]|uniref:Endonuclease YncB(Thermonuclease family) n=1 Tax=Plasticicumulans lactativorans TaxID=1133106 RepID=A0A4V2SCW6_9GAMM|nr:thermonuclease family protein [Plasticicumulans lactativorans]TCO80970.1 endonuclease YncB(thermonuclease family) [Plasticicumulans lactativorans]